MNAKLFYTLNLFVCMGIGACNGMNINRMDKDRGSNVPRDSGIGTEPSTSSGTNVSSSEQNNKKIRKDTVEQISNMVEKELGCKFPEEYKNFLIEYDTVRLKNIGL
ncbi:MAG: SMI1/KNR4 family protein (plasmid) [Candidatus Cardinium sp.]|uniref:SMI1/KNR4 family protein n=1 Tax=Cardinium endosymbiont of Dermatophagoides farinae TaxID=2597823 RepID=UPI00118316A7|nr:SMI1/KNR4 family protein [Cardinium endosymbiont of Dermatophagoides farinae]TSJ79778.1 SMI1/KNR4 family protein [Cardinium endosymbiont of Dermatophagoides farinae]UWW97577.1 MAG: SMI1/KNR4 family protein [Candidatus Cardinium sp.]